MRLLGGVRSYGRRARAPNINGGEERGVACLLKLINPGSRRLMRGGVPERENEAIDNSH